MSNVLTAGELADKLGEVIAEHGPDVPVMMAYDGWCQDSIRHMSVWKEESSSGVLVCLEDRVPGGESI